MNILITSVMGHIGYALALKAKESGHKVIGLFNKSKDKAKINILKKKKN